MNILEDDRNQSDTEHKGIVRWYVMRYLSMGRNQNSELEEENKRRKKMSMPELEYFAPNIIVGSKGKTKKTMQQPLVLNYVFVHSDIKDIKEFRLIHTNFQLLKRWDVSSETSLKDGKNENEGADSDNVTKDPYMYVPDREMESFIVVAKAYCNNVPTLLSSQTTLLKGDKVRILDGDFCGVEGILQRHNRNGEIVMLPVGNLITVPLLTVSPKHIEVLEFSKNGTHLYDVLDELQDNIRDLMHKRVNDVLKTDDIALARYYLTRYGKVKLESKKLYGRFNAMMMMLHYILGNGKELESAVDNTVKSLVFVTNIETKAFIFSALYVCTGIQEYFEKADAVAMSGQNVSRSRKLQCVADDLLLYRKLK